MKKFLLLTAAALIAAPGLMIADCSIPAYKATYDMSFHGMKIGSSSTSLTKTKAGFRRASVLHLSFFGTKKTDTTSTVGAITADHTFLTESYQSQDDSSAPFKMTFDRSAGVVDISGFPGVTKVSIPKGTNDSDATNLNLAYAISQGKTGDLTYSIISKDGKSKAPEVQSVTYHVSKGPSIKTPVGTVETVEVDSTDNTGLLNKSYYAKSDHYVLVKAAGFSRGKQVFGLDIDTYEPSKVCLA